MDKQEEKKLNQLITGLENKLAEQSAEILHKNRQLEIEAALEIVRVKATGMRTSSELAETSAVLFQQLNELNIRAIRTGVGIIDEENAAMEIWLTIYSGSSEVFKVLDYVNMHIHPVFENIIAARRENKPFALTKLSGSEVKQYYQTMSTYFTLPVQEQYNNAEHYYSFFFTEGAINVVTKEALTEEECTIVVRFAKVFGLIYARYEDFIRLDNAKQSIENALTELKATQSQLIQSEKMASFGELTAGIAHEIKNPLNFINNFSELNTELADELKQEIENGNFDEVRIIAENIKENEKKINYHGKRADGIVKGMLQHSRSSSGQKELTDINALCDEYLRLAYHGRRAKDKSLNATIKTDFDTSIVNINIIPQEIGRVILNLINNALYAVEDKIKSGIEGYEPIVTLRTKKIFVQPDDLFGREKVEISIIDNGNGIHESIKEKIFQPFFTTKPSGSGTGLGLSLSYDIVKAHDGELKVESIPGKGSQFRICLPYSR